MQNSFTERVLNIVKDIPEGQTLTYAEVARRAGSPRAARAVGNIMKNNYDGMIPCHRVIGSDGAMRGYNRGGSKVKERLLQDEGAL